MKKSRISTYPLFIWVLIFFFVLLPLLLFCGILVYGVWTMNMPFDWKVPFPEGTQIIQQTDTHQGLFRREGIAVMVAKIPEQHIQSYGDRLRRWDFSSGCPFPDLFSSIEAAKDILDAPNTLYTYQDEAVAFIEEAYSDWFTAIYDLDTGLFCSIECDT